MAWKTRMSTLSLMNRTELSAIEHTTPPEWRLRGEQADWSALRLEDFLQNRKSPL